MGLLLKLFYKRSDPEGSRRADLTARRRLRGIAPVPQSLVERRWTSSNPTLNVHIPPPSYVIVEPQDRLPQHPQPGSICTNPPQRPHINNGGPRGHDPRGIHPSSLPRRSSATPLVAQAHRDAHADDNIRRHQSTSALRPAARQTVHNSNTQTQSIGAPLLIFHSPNPSQVNTNRLHHRLKFPLRLPPPLCRHLDPIRPRQFTTALTRPYQPPSQTPPHYRDQTFPPRPVTLRWQRRHEAEWYERRLETRLDQPVLPERRSMPLSEIPEISETQRWEAHIRRDCKYCRKRRDGVGSVKRWLGR
jgi:hypothetical protein